jgi:hypothetical protein
MYQFNTINSLLSRRFTMESQQSRKEKGVFATKLFTDRNTVESAYKSALDEGYTQDDINLLMTDETRNRYFPKNDTKSTVIGDKSMDGLALGGAFGGAVGGIAAAIAAIGTAVVIPGLGIIVAGPLAAGLAGAGAGAIAGGLVGSLVGLGVPEERVKEYEQGIKSGGILMAVNTKDPTRSKKLETDWDKF